jgi:uncharacterized protein YndB with AHSA1/START domain
MSRVGATIDIDAPPEVVFAFFDDLENARVLMPRIVDVVSVEPLADGGRRVEYTVRTRSGSEASVTSEHVEYDPPRRTVARGYEAGLGTLSTRMFEPYRNGTRVTTFVEWQLPSRYVGGLFTAQLRRPLRRSLEAMLAAAKDALEG